MTGAQVFTIIFYRVLSFIAVPLFIMIFFGKAFGDSAPDWAVWVMLGLILAFWIWWGFNLAGTLRMIREFRTAQKS